MSSSEGAQYDPGPGGGAALNRGARGLAQKIKDWTDARIAAAIAGRSGLTSLKINGATIGLRQHLDVQMTGATGEDHPELDLLRAVLPTGGGGGGGVWTQIAQHTVPAGGEGEFSFSAIPSTFDHLVVVGDNILFVNTESFSAAGGGIWVQPNDWDGSDYRSYVHRYGAVTHGIELTTLVGIHVGYADALEWGGSDQAAFTLWIPGYAVDVPTRIFYGHGAKGFTNHVSWQNDGVWRRPLDPPDNTSIITILRFVADLGNDNASHNLFAEGSRFTLYGLKNGTGGGGGAALTHCIAMLQSASLDVHPNTFTPIPLDTEEDDPDGWHTGSNAYFVVPSDGIYDCQGRFCWATEGATTYNGGTYRRFEIVGGEGQVNLKAPTAANSQGGQTQELAVTLLLTAGTHVYLAVRHDSDGDMTYVSTGGLRPRLSVTKVG